MSINVSEGEGWGLSVVEANTFGVPVLAYRRPGLRDSIRDGETGWLIEDEEELGPAVLRALALLSDDAVADAMGNRARQWASLFSWDGMASQILSLIRAEEGRLAHLSDNRRLSTDLSTVARVPVDVLPVGLDPKFRYTDKAVMTDDHLVVLLRNTDTDTAVLALHRAGIPSAMLTGSGTRLSVATTVDLISPALSASAQPDAEDQSVPDELAG